MKQDRSDFVRAAGSMFEIVKKLSHAVGELGGSDDDFRRLLADDVLCRRVAGLIVAPSTSLPHPLYAIAVYPAKTLGDLIAAGAFASVKEGLNETNFPSRIAKPYEADLELVQFNRNMTTLEIDEAFGTLGLRHATHIELLTLIAAHAEALNGSTIVALGSSWTDASGKSFVAYASQTEGRKLLSLYRSYPQYEWGTRAHFLGVRTS